MPTRQYKAKANDTLFSIAMDHGVAVEDLARINGIKGIHQHLSAGRLLLIPVANSSTSSSVSSPMMTHRVCLSENLPNIAQRYGVSVEELVQINDIVDSRILWVGQKLKIPLETPSPSNAEWSPTSHSDTPDQAETWRPPGQENPYRDLTVAQRAAKIKDLLETSIQKVFLGTGRDILEIFQASESMNEFLLLQDMVGMESVLDECSNWTAIQLGSIGPIQQARDSLNQKRAEYIIESTQDYGHELAQVFIIHMFNNMFGDDIKLTLKLLNQEKRQSQTLLRMPAVGENLKTRGVILADYKDREFKATDIARGLGSGIKDIFSSSEISKGATSSRYFGQKQTLPKEHQDVLDQLELDQFKKCTIA